MRCSGGEELAKKEELSASHLNDYGATSWEDVQSKGLTRT
jgi:hypothetical protein